MGRSRPPTVREFKTRWMHIFSLLSPFTLVAGFFLPPSCIVARDLDSREGAHQGFYALLFSVRTRRTRKKPCWQQQSRSLAPLFSFSIVFFRSAILPRSPRGSKLRKSGQKCPFGSAREYREAFRFEPVSKNRSFFGRSGREEPNTKDWTTVVLQHISRSLFEPLMLSNSNETSKIFECERKI